MFGAGSSTPIFGAASTPAFGATPSTPLFGTPSTTPAFGAATSSSLFGTPSTPAFGAASSSSLFGTPSSTPAFGAAAAPGSIFGTPSATPALGATTPSLFGAPSSSSTPSLFGTPAASQPLFGASSPAPSFGTPFGAPAFGTPSTPAFGGTATQASGLGFQPSPSFGGAGMITTQMAPITPLPSSLVDRDIRAIIDAYRDESGNPLYRFRHLLFSVTAPSARVKPDAAPDVLWSEAMAKLEGMDNTDRERLWPQLMNGFKDLSDRLKLQDEALASDKERLILINSNVKLLQRHFQADTVPRIERLKQQEQAIQRRLLRFMRIVEAMENKGLRIPLYREEADLREKLDAITGRLKGPNAELPKRIYNLLLSSRIIANSSSASSSAYLSGLVGEQSLSQLLEVLHRQTEATESLGNVLKRDTRDLEIIMSESADVVENGVRRRALTAN